MTNRKSTAKRAKAQAKPSEPTKAPEATGGGGAESDRNASGEMHSAVEKNSAMLRDASMASRIRSSERRKLLDELLVEIAKDIRTPFELSRGGLPDCLRIEQTVESLRRAVAERDRMLARIRMHLYRALSSPTLPDSRGGIVHMLRSAPTAWHIRTVVEAAVDVLIENVGHQERETASMRCLGEIARLFRTDLKLQAKPSRRIREALEHPAYIEALNRPPPKRTRGGTGGNESVQVVFTWTEGAWKEFDEQYNPDFNPLIYSDTETYVLKFMEFAKEFYERDNERFGWAEAWTGMKARTNTNKAGEKPKQSFSLFAAEIEKNVRNILRGWQKSYAPIWVFKDEPPNART